MIMLNPNKTYPASSMRSSVVAGYITRTTSPGGASRVLAEDGEWYADTMLGPGMRCARIFKTIRGASKVRGGRVCTAHAVNACGIELAAE